MKIPLDSALKYNWWTPESKKGDISIKTRMEYLLKYGTFEELMFLFHTLSYREIKDCFDRIKGDEYHWNKKRRFIIEYILQLHNHKKHAKRAS